MNTDYMPEEMEQTARALKSSISKCEKARTKLSEASPQLKWVDRQLKAFYIAVALIESVHGDRDEQRFSGQELWDAAETIALLIVKCEPLLTKFKDRSPQKTLAARRIQAFQLATALIARELEIGYA